MNFSDIKNEIRELKKQEQLHRKKLESIKKNETRSFNTMNININFMMNEFQYKLTELSDYYNRINMSNINRNSSKFISEHDITVFEQFEGCIYNAVTNQLDNLEKCEIEWKIEDDFPDKSDNSVQESLYLIFQAEMTTVDLEAELAAVDAQIQYLSSPYSNKNPLQTLEECEKEIKTIGLQMSDSMREICNNRLILKLKPDVDQIVQSQTELAHWVHHILEQLYQQRDRQIQRLSELDRESEIHDEVQNIFDSIVRLADGFQKLHIQLEQTNEVISHSMREPKLSLDEQLMVRIRNHFDDIGTELFQFPHFTVVDDNGQSMREMFANEEIRQSKLQAELQCIIDDSFPHFCTIRNFSENFINLVTREIYNQWNDKITFINKKNSDTFSCIDPDRLTDRVKEIKEKLKKIKVDMFIA